MKAYKIKYAVKIRFSCGTERYVTGTEGHNAKWELEKPAQLYDSPEYPVDLALGLNFNHLSGDLGGFACCVALPVVDGEVPVNPSEEDEKFSEYYRMGKLREVIDSYKQEESNES